MRVCASGWWALELGPSLLIVLGAVSSWFERRNTGVLEADLGRGDSTAFLEKIGIYCLPCSPLCHLYLGC